MTVPTVTVPRALENLTVPPGTTTASVGEAYIYTSTTN